MAAIDLRRVGGAHSLRTAKRGARGTIVAVPVTHSLAPGDPVLAVRTGPETVVLAWGADAERLRDEAEEADAARRVARGPHGPPPARAVHALPAVLREPERPAGPAVCAACGGTGYGADDEPCEVCGGTGVSA